MPVTPLPIFIGHDWRQGDATAVCRTSLLAHASVPLHIVELDRRALVDVGLHNRPYHLDENCQRIDDRDGKPFSTDFTFTRFLVPALSLYRGWALFCDSDFMFMRDVAELFALADPGYAVMCVQHDHDPVEATKMDGCAQTCYRRKNWSSLVLWNCAHPSNRGALRVQHVNERPGAWLHAFEWLDPDEIGALPKLWNWLAGVDRMPEYGKPHAVHYTLGIPTMPSCADAPYAYLWRAYKEIST